MIYSSPMVHLSGGEVRETERFSVHNRGAGDSSLLDETA